MPQPIIIAHHLIWTAYGYWLPNDPRGSMSKTIACNVIRELGEIHYGRRVVQPASREVRAFRERAKEVLKHPLLNFPQSLFPEIAAAFAEVIENERYTCWACAVMPDHAHVLIRKHKHQAEDMIVNLQEASRLRLRNCGARTPDHPVWGGPGWKVFLDHPTEVRRTIRYIRDNPEKWRLPRQQWPFVKSYDNWPLHPGHNPNSPYARRLRDYREYGE